MLAGCGVTASSNYANMTQQEAEQQALTALVNDANDPASDAYHHHYRLRSAGRSVEPDGRDAWKVVIDDRTAQVRLCVFTRLDATGLGTSPSIDIARCG